MHERRDGEAGEKRDQERGSERDSSVRHGSSLQDEVMDAGSIEENDNPRTESTPSTRSARRTKKR